MCKLNCVRIIWKQKTNFWDTSYFDLIPAVLIGPFTTALSFDLDMFTTDAGFGFLGATTANPFFEYDGLPG